MLGNGFTRKKVGSLTLGEKLQKIRTDYKITLAEISKSTGIRKEHLEFLEKGNYAKLPADVYVRGFLRSYAQFLGADPEVLIRLYNRERSIARNLNKEPEARHVGVGTKSHFFPSFIITPKVLIGVISAVVIFTVAGYLYREFHAFVAEPYLVVVDPSNNQVVSSDKVIVSGKTDRDAKFFLNGEPRVVNESGEFREEMSLRLGMNSIVVKVLNRFGKERVETIAVVAEYIVPENTSKFTNGESHVPKKEKLVLSLAPQVNTAVSIVVRVDGEEMYRGELVANETKEFECMKECSVDSTSAKNTLALWNSEELKSLSNTEGEILNALFTVDESL